MAAVHYHVGRFPPVDIDWPSFIPLLGPAAAAVARYQPGSEQLPSLPLTLCAQVSDKLTCVSYVSDNAWGPS